MKNIIFLLKKLTRLLEVQMNDKRMQSIKLIETYAYGTNKDLVSDKE